MTEEEAKKSIKNIPLGSLVQLIKRNGSILEVRLVSHEVSGIERKDYGDIVVPALPPAIIVNGGTRFGNFRMEVHDIVNIARIG